jgi:hypothetical protein
MRRSVLITVAVLGGLVCLLGGTVLFSALQDSARTGTNSVESAAAAASADIQLATATLNGNTITCGAFSDNLSSGLVTATEVSPGYASGAQAFCIKNVGSQPVTLSALVDELTDVDFDCTGDEAANGDATCGGDKLGELSSVLGTGYSTRDCVTGNATLALGPSIKDHETTPQPLGTLAAAATGCFSLFVNYPPATPATAVQTAQSDRATWRFKFTGQA